ncbi:hypothetical protein VTN96DRAFT_828 [Rasamsonia emersonii]|uniref:Cytochrome c mitochondrial import factor (Cyc2) n=1 Tax=Rasamsonia emersonii (strain ATCC 16479 / CBS 393.64 / IMI 116815) TaxID=1408163 RepID=A0A0F4YQP7_RASE3|nr:Cytochrome c mitochondrial import factor (Cyc2) [Rasamsonia emersonii CBS 393.64]KKA19953.1 Cytochrome c mitochondrial import factor (Cyc2) [Rasamsonia emersonii CBS 393.64]
MTVRIPGPGLWSRGHPLRFCRRAGGLSVPLSHPPRRHGSSASASLKKHTWLRVTVVTVAAGAIGAYIRSKQDAGNTTLNPLTFAHYRLVSRQPVSSTNSIFTLDPVRPGHNRETYESAWQTGVWSVMFKQPQLQIGRDYTPLPPVGEGSNGGDSQSEGDESLRFLIRRDPHGEVSRYLHGLEIGAEIEIRGPQTECPIPSDVQDILFIAGGTGIAPALQAAYTLLRRTTDTRKPRMHILWASRKREDCLGGVSDTSTDAPTKSSWWKFGGSTKPSSPSSSSTSPAPATTGAVVRELQTLKSQYPGQLTVDYFVDEENSFISKKDIRDFVESVSSSGSPQKRMILVSGPEGFISYMAGPKIWGGGRQLQGPVQGIIKELDLQGWTVWKL